MNVNNAGAFLDVLAVWKEELDGARLMRIEKLEKRMGEMVL